VNSLAALVDRIEQKRYFGQKTPARELLGAAREIASRQGLPGSYAGMFAPTRLDFRRGIRVFTGEPVRSGAATAHILGEECCRLLLKLDVKDRLVSAALARAEAGMLEAEVARADLRTACRLLLLWHLLGVALAPPGCGRAGQPCTAVQRRPARAGRLPVRWRPLEQVPVLLYLAGTHGTRNTGGQNGTALGCAGCRAKPEGTARGRPLPEAASGRA